MIHRGRFTASLESSFVVFLIGMRINRPLLVHKWLPVATSMPRMLKELYARPELGFLHAEAWFGRTIIFLQYWRSMEQLLAYATNKEAEHLPAWKAKLHAIAARDLCRQSNGWTVMNAPRAVRLQRAPS